MAELYWLSVDLHRQPHAVSTVETLSEPIIDRAAAQVCQLRILDVLGQVAPHDLQAGVAEQLLRSKTSAPLGSMLRAKARRNACNVGLPGRCAALARLRKLGLDLAGEAALAA